MCPLNIIVQNLVCALWLILARDLISYFVPDVNTYLISTGLHDCTLQASEHRKT